jgi:hypothetical protein
MSFFRSLLIRNVLKLKPWKPLLEALLSYEEKSFAAVKHASLLRRRVIYVAEKLSGDGRRESLSVTRSVTFAKKRAPIL